MSQQGEAKLMNKHHYLCEIIVWIKIVIDIALQHLIGGQSTVQMFVNLVKSAANTNKRPSQEAKPGDLIMSVKRSDLKVSRARGIDCFYLGMVMTPGCPETSASRQKMISAVYGAQITLPFRVSAIYMVLGDRP